MLARELPNRAVRGRLHAVIPDMGGRYPVCLEKTRQRLRQLVIDEQLHAACRTG